MLEAKRRKKRKKTFQANNQASIKNISILPIAIWQTARSLFGFVLKTNSTQIQDLLKLSRLCFYHLKQMNIVATLKMLEQVFLFHVLHTKAVK
jgi:hypothetical protein